MNPWGPKISYEQPLECIASGGHGIKASLGHGELTLTLPHLRERRHKAVPRVNLRPPGSLAPPFDQSGSTQTINHHSPVPFAGTH